MVTLFVSCWKPAPASLRELSTMKSNCLRRNFSWACTNSFTVSRAKPTRRWSARFCAPKAAAMSRVGTRLSSNPLSPRFIFSAATASTVKSATAAHMIAALHEGKSAVVASYISAALSTSVRRILGCFTSSFVGPLTNSTSQPLLAHSSAKA